MQAASFPYLNNALTEVVNRVRTVGVTSLTATLRLSPVEQLVKKFSEACISSARLTNLRSSSELSRSGLSRSDPHFVVVRGFTKRLPKQCYSPSQRSSNFRTEFSVKTFASNHRRWQTRHVSSRLDAVPALCYGTL